MAMLPAAVHEAVVEVAGTAFYRHDVLRHVLGEAGVPGALYDRHRFEGSKYNSMRSILADLQQMGTRGWAVQQQIVRRLAAMRVPIERYGVDARAAVEALARLRAVAREHDLAVKAEAGRGQQTSAANRQKYVMLEQSLQRRQEIQERYRQLLKSTNLQRRGYELERLVADLFRIHGIEYREAFRSGNHQIDGSFKYEGFHYLVEVRFREKAPTQEQIEWFAAKVAKKLGSTRGLFISITPFSDETVAEFAGRPSSIILMDGFDLTLIVDGHITLTDALEVKIRKASQEGIIYCRLQEFLGAAS